MCTNVGIIFRKCNSNRPNHFVYYPSFIMSVLSGQEKRGKDGMMNLRKGEMVVETEDPHGQKWVQCILCHVWVHEECGVYTHLSFNVRVCMHLKVSLSLCV